MKNLKQILQYTTGLSLALLLLASCKKEVPTKYILSENITENLTLTNHSKKGADYQVEGCISVTNGAVLTIEPGVTIQFAQGSCLKMTDFGALNAVGTASDPIYFTGLQATNGFWKGLFFDGSNNTNNLLEYCVVEYASGENNSYQNAAVVIGLNPVFSNGASRLTLRHTTIRNSSNHGLYVAKNSFLNIENCTITENDKSPVLLTLQNMGVLNNTNDFSGNTQNYVLLDATTIQASYVENDVTLPKINVPYAIKGEVDVQAAWTIEAGVEFIMMSNAGIYVSGFDGGSLYAVGNIIEHITFKGLQATKGFWTGIATEYGAPYTLHYCDFSDAGNRGLPGLTVPKGTLHAGSMGGAPTISVKNCNFSNGLNHGISIGGSSNYNADIQTINTFTNIDGDNVHFY